MQKLPPKLILQVWDNDMFTADDFLGETPAPCLAPAGVEVGTHG